MDIEWQPWQSLIRASTVYLPNFLLKYLNKNIKKWTGPVDKSGKFHSAYIGKSQIPSS